MPATREAALAPRAELSEALYAKLSPGPGRPAPEVAAHQRARIHSAMIEIVAERGYGAVRVRELARLAGVSTRAFYKHFSGKEDCFLHTYESVVRRTAKRIVASQAGELDWSQRLRLAFDAFARELEREPHAAHLALVEAYAAGPVALQQIRSAECTFAAMIAESFSRAPDGIVVPPLIAEGLVAGAASVARSRLLAGRKGGLAGLGEELVDWALCYRNESAAGLSEINHRSAPGASTQDIAHVLSNAENGTSRSSSDARALILSAVVKLAAAGGYDALTGPRIRTAAGVQRKGFDAHFESVEACFLAALEQRVGDVLALAARAKAAASTWEAGIHSAMSVICGQIASEPVMARLCFVEIFALGGEGMHFHERSMTEIAGLIRNGAPAKGRPSKSAAEASAGAIWGILRHQVASGRTQQLPRVAPTLAFLALAPYGSGSQSQAFAEVRLS